VGQAILPGKIAPGNWLSSRPKDGLFYARAETLRPAKAMIFRKWRGVRPVAFLYKS
jgi:hypothetical protein